VKYLSADFSLLACVVYVMCSKQSRSARYAFCGQRAGSTVGMQKDSKEGRLKER